MRGEQFNRIRKTIEKSVQGSLSTYEWDDNTSVKCTEPAAEALRQIAYQLMRLFRPAKRTECFSEKTLEFFKLLLDATATDVSSEQFNLIRNTITKLIQEKLTTYEWDDNMSVKRTEPAAEALRQIAWQVPDLFPPPKRPAYCSEKGIEFFKFLLEATDKSAS